MCCVSKHTCKVLKVSIGNKRSAWTAGSLRRGRSWGSPVSEDQDNSLNTWLLILISLSKAFTSNTANKLCQVSYRLLKYSASCFKAGITFPLTSSSFQPIIRNRSPSAVEWEWYSEGRERGANSEHGVHYRCGAAQPGCRAEEGPLKSDRLSPYKERQAFLLSCVKGWSSWKREIQIRRFN